MQEATLFMGAIAICSLLIPSELLGLPISAAGIATIPGARKILSLLIVFTLASNLLPIRRAPLNKIIRLWILWLLVAIRVIGPLTTTALGKRGSEDMVNHLARDIAKFIIAAPVVITAAARRSMVSTIR